MNKILKYTRRIQDVEYDEQNYILTVYFNSNITRRYFNVPKKIHENLQNALNKDWFYQNEIDGLYRVQ